MSFTYHDDWLADENAFGLSPGMPLVKGQFVPEAGQDMLALLGDSAPDTWGRTVMRRFEGRMAEAEGRRSRTLQESDYLLGVNEEDHFSGENQSPGPIPRMLGGLRNADHLA